jgi:hypothetical protein
MCAVEDETGHFGAGTQYEVVLASARTSVRGGYGHDSKVALIVEHTDGLIADVSHRRATANRFQWGSEPRTCVVQ